jgi:16S rRNA (uracil1498-N3)-methyltransferase
VIVMSERFFADEPIHGRRVRLRGDEATHLAQVMRRGVGSEVTLFDGSGLEFRARVESVRRGAVELVVIESNDVDRELTFELVVASAVPKGDRLRWMVEKLTELGVARWVPLATEHSVVKPRDSVLERMRRVVIEASKQCGRNRLMEIGAVTGWAELIEQVKPESARFFGDAAGEPLGAVRFWDRSPKAKDQVAFAVGPEGGLTRQETSAAEAAGWRAVSLGSRTLRVETAAVACSAGMAVRCSR